MRSAIHALHAAKLSEAIAPGLCAPVPDARSEGECVQSCGALVYALVRRIRRLHAETEPRKYKVPKAVMAERLEIGWCNVARIRAFCLATHGYDPEIENWDQSLFHSNESGSANTLTLAVAGSLVPLVGGHADTRERWTANLTTSSDKAGVQAEGPPYCELLFKAEVEVLELRLREYVRSRGFGPWLTVATAPNGSYRTLAF